jgi:hypothetical protein
MSGDYIMPNHLAGDEKKDQTIRVLIEENKLLAATIAHMQLQIVEISKRLAHHDHMGGVYQTRILRIEKLLDEIEGVEQT